MKHVSLSADAAAPGALERKITGAASRHGVAKKTGIVRAVFAW